MPHLWASIKKIDTVPADANDIATNGAYQVLNNVENCNFGWGTLVHIESVYAMQYFFGGSGTEFKFAARSRLGNGVWRPWYKVSLTEV